VIKYKKWGEKMAKRIKEISVMNVLLALMVIFIHVSGDAVITLDKYKSAYIIVMTLWRLCQVAVYGFIFLSGLKLCLKEDIDYEKFYISRFKTIIIPYIVWVIIYYIYYYNHSYYPKDANHVKILYEAIITGNMASHFYFVIIIAQFYLLAPFFKKMVKKSNAKVCIFVSLLITLISMYAGQNVLYNDRIFTTYIFYFVFGCFMGANYEKFKSFVKKYFIVISLAFLISAFLFIFVAYYMNIGKIPYNFYIEYIRTVYCICAILFIFGVCLKIKNVYNNTLVQKTDSASYYIYLVHSFFIPIINDIMLENSIKTVKYTFPIRAVYVYLVSICLCISYVELKNRFLKRGELKS